MADTTATAPSDDERYAAHKQRQADYQRKISAAGREIGTVPAVEIGRAHV